MAEKTFEFGLTINKARRDGEKMIVTAYASDTLKDNHNERFDAHAMNQMLDKLRDEEVPLMTSHKDSFGFGKSIEGVLLPVQDGGIGLEVDFELNPKYPQSEELFNEVKTGDCEKQISVGGKLNKKNPRAAYMTRKGEKVLHDFNLDHFCTTRPEKAANARTAFKTAVFKSLEDGGLTADVWKTLEIDDEEANELSSMGTKVGGNVEKFFFMTPPGGPYAGNTRSDEPRGDDLEGENRSKSDLPSFKTMRDNGYSSYYVPLYWEGHKVLEALKDVKDGKSRIAEKIDSYPVDEVSGLMVKTGVKDPKKIAGDGNVGLYAVYVGADNMDARNVGLDPQMKRAVPYSSSFGRAVNNSGEETYDDIGRLTGGGFLFAKEGRALPGEEGYTPFWKVPSVMEAQVLIPDAVNRLEARDGDLEKDDNDNWVEKETLGLTETRMMPFYRKKIKIRTKSAENHSHELRLVLNNKGEIEDGYTFVGASDFAHGHTKWGEDHVHNIRKGQNGKITLSEALGHTHTFTMPEMPKEVADMAFKTVDVLQKTVESGGYFSKGVDGDVVTYDDAPKTSDLSQTGQSSYALFLKAGDSNSVRQLGKITRMEAYRLASGATKGETKVTVGRSVGKSDGKLLYRMISEFSSAGEGEMGSEKEMETAPEDSEKIKTEVVTMSGEKEEKKVTEDAPVEEKATEDVEVKEEAKKTEVIEEKEIGTAEKIGSTILNALGLAKPSSQKVERTSALLGTAGENLKDIEITGEDATTLLTDVSGVLGQLKANLEAGKLDLGSLPEKDAKIIRAFMGGEEMPKTTMKEDPVVEKEKEPFDMEALSERLAEKTLAKINEKMKETLPETKEPAEEALKTEDASAKEGDAPETGDAPKTEVPEGEEEAKKEDESDKDGEKEKSDDAETVEKTGDVSNKQIFDALSAISERVEKVETVAGVSKSLDGQEGEAKKKGKGIFHGVIPSVNKARFEAGKKK